MTVLVKSNGPAGTEVQAAPETKRLEIVPAADVMESKDAFVVTLDMPGVGGKDIEVSVEAHELQVRGRRTVAAQESGCVMHAEFEAVDYARSFRLPADVDEMAISASMKDGVLRVTLPKAEQAKPRNIAVEWS